MKKYATSEIRNVGLYGHGGTGKTSLCEAMLYTTGATERLGRVDDGNTVSDYDPDEVKRKISLYASVAPCEWKNHKINVIDTPGFLDFMGDVVGSMAVVEAAVLTVAAPAGVEVGMERAWELAESRSLPRLIIINKMDKENADFAKCVAGIRDKLSATAVPVQLPIGAADHFKGIVDLVDMVAYTFDAKGQAVKADVPKDMEADVKEARARLVEQAAEGDDELTMKYLEEENLAQEEVVRGLQLGVAQGRIFPILAGAAFKNIGASLLMDAIARYVPSPDKRGKVSGTNPKTGQTETRDVSATGHFAGLVWKTTADPYVGKLNLVRVWTGTFKPDMTYYNAAKERDEKVGPIFSMRGKHQENVTEAPAGDLVTVAKLADTTTGDTLCDKDHPFVLPKPAFPEPVINMAVFPKSKGDEDKLSAGLHRLTDEDPTFHTRRDTETRETIISGLGELHLEVSTERLKRKFGVDVSLDVPKVPYKETIRGTIKIEGKHKKQTGGHGQFGHVWLELEPLERGKMFEFVDHIVGGVVPRNFIPSVEKGVRSQMEEGVLAGFPVVDIKVTLYDGSYHSVDSSDMAFQLAGRLAMKEGARKAQPVLLEPIMHVEVMVPDHFMGDVIGGLNSKRGRISGMEPQARGMQLVKGLVPLAEMLRYSIDLRSITQGRGTFHMTFSHYEEVPPQITDHIVASAKSE
ncbi:MAG TPA: elongation factor G [Candidatus Xenobia bacterium]